jgi:uncharacterized membrane protein YjgN (DUF898 family)
LGIYSAWAKVRSKKYLLNNTLLEGLPFDYLADPFGILKGRLFAFSLLLTYVLMSRLSPMAHLVFIPLFLLLMPWLTINSLAFNCHYTSYRNISFNFYATYRQAFLYFTIYPILIPLTLGIIAPYVVKKQKEFIVNHSGFGNTPFTLSLETGAMYQLYLMTVGLGFFAYLLFAIFMVLGVYFGFGAQLKSPTPPSSMQLLLIMYPPVIVLTLCLHAFLHAQQSNLIFSQLRLGPLAFRSTLRTGKLLAIYLSNLVGIIFSLGLLTPWAIIRLYRYKISCLSVESVGDLNHFRQEAQQPVNALGQEIGDAFDIDFSL